MSRNFLLILNWKEQQEFAKLAGSRQSKGNSQEFRSVIPSQTQVRGKTVAQFCS
jgi:hypothetical protein